MLLIGPMLLAGLTISTLAVQQSDADQTVQPAKQDPAQLQQMVAPFALYPDELVAQILAASTYPTQIVEAERWMQKHQKLEGDNLAKEVDKESWDPSVKALTQFPSVLSRMDQNLSWTSTVGDAYFNQQQDVLDAIQVLRKRAESAGTLKSTSQQTVSTQDSTIIIEPAAPDVCYLPMYDPWTVYGAPLAVYPGFFFDPWIGPAYYFGPAIGLGFYGGFGWGWQRWGFDWHRREVVFNHNRYVSRSPSVFHHSGDRGGFRAGQGGSIFRGTDHNGGRGGIASNPNNAPNHTDARGFGGGRSSTGTRSGIFSGFGQGGMARGSAVRGQSSFGRGGFGGGARGGFGGGGMRGGGSGRGGGGRH